MPLADLQYRPPPIPADVTTLVFLRDKLRAHVERFQTQPANRGPIVLPEDMIELVMDMATIASILERLLAHTIALERADHKTREEPK